MVTSDREVYQQMKRLTVGAAKDIELQFSTPCIYVRNMKLMVLKAKIMELDRLCNKLLEADTGSKDRQTDISVSELSKYTGKDGNPAYVAVNGIVYDVTNNAAWAAATHFGLTAGKDLSEAFSSCHVDPAVLGKLIVVGKLV